MSVEGICIPSAPEDRHVKLPPPPEPRGEEVLIDVECAGLGNWDEMMQTGGWGESSLARPVAHGVQVAGRVSGLGPAAGGFAVGDEVLTHAYLSHAGGSWAKQIAASSTAVAPKPAGLSWEQAAALPIPGLAAYESLDEVLRVRAGETLLVHGAAGVTGGLLVQLAVARGLRVVATAGSTATAYVDELGADAVIDPYTADWPDRARAALGGRGASAAVVAAPDGAAQALSLVADAGRMATLADAAPPSPERGIEPRCVRVHPDGDLLAQAAQALARGEITLAEPCAFALTDVEQALQTVLACTGRTPVVVRVAELSAGH
jgi:NADPH:quinone reductase-like Zn-dependent oxidoreductase